MSNLIPYQGNMLVPQDAKLAAPVLCFPGSNVLNYEGAAVLALTPDVIALCTAQGVIEKVSLWAIEDVQVKRFEGILIQRQTSVGTMTTPPPDNYGIEIQYRTELRLKGRLKIMTFFSIVAHQWENEIRNAAFGAQGSQIPDMTPKKPN